MSADAGKDGRDMLALQAKVKDLSARLAMAETRLDALETPESAVDRAHQGLREIQERIEDADPGRVKGYEQEKFEERKRAAM